jgi:hypothetical protein
MGQNVVEAIFNSKNNLNDFYPNFPGVENFDIQRKHLFYGRVDREGDAVILDDSNLKTIYGGRKGTHFAVDFVCDAFDDMKKNINRVGTAGLINRDGLYSPKLRVMKAWSSGDLETGYRNHIDQMYTNFVDSYLSINRRYEKISSFKDFVREFLRYSIRIIDKFPLTKTGFITTVHASPYSSGLMIDIASEGFGLQDNAKVLKYIKDPNFFFFVNEVKKFGFMIDKNAPWRLVYNLASGLLDKKNSGVLNGAQKYMNDKGVSYENIFQTYYRKAYLDELLNIRNKFIELYTIFYTQFSTYEEMQYVICEKSNTSTKSSFNLNDEVLGRIRTVQVQRSAPPTDGEEMDEYWLKVLLKTRLLESGHTHTPENFDFYAVEAVKRKRLFGEIAALKYINDLTRGFHVTKFNIKGAYWQGISHDEYEMRKVEAKRHADNPSMVNYSITGTKNIQ